MTVQSAATPLTVSPLRRWGIGAALVAAIVLSFLVLSGIGARQAERGERVLSVLNPTVDFIRNAGRASGEWMLDHSQSIAWATSLAAAAVACLGLIARGRAALSLVLLAAAVSTVTWGEVLLLADQTSVGIGLYLAGIGCAAVLGFLYPLQRLAEFPALPMLKRRGDRQAADVSEVGAATAPAAWHPSWGRECVLIFLLTLVGLVARLYALPELPNHFDLETIESMVASRTPTGLRWWIVDQILASGGGCLHQFHKKILFDLFGTSIFTLRLSAVLFGVAAIPLMYWLVRRLAGAGPAIAATIFFLTAPEQLFWSRCENTFFIPVILVALITAHLGLWLVQRFSIASVCAAALWMPVCRLCYAAGIIMSFYLPALFGHALLFVRGAWRKSWYVVPMLAGGLALWFLSLSILLSALGNFHWRYIDPVNMHGGALWRKQGEFLEASPRELVVLQAKSITNNLGDVLKGLTYHVNGFSHWNERADLGPRHMTMINVTLTVMAALAFGYLLGQIWDRRAFALLFWVGLGLLPGLMSNEAADRRIAAMFPALYVMAAVLLGAVVRLVRLVGSRSLARATTVALGVVVAAVAWANLTSHLLLPINPTVLEGPSRFVTPLFETSDVIFHNLDRGVAEGLLLGNLDRFLTRDPTPGLQFVAAKEWLSTALNPACDFKDRAYSLTMSPERVDRLRAAYHPRRITFLLQDLPHNRSSIDLMREIYPAAEVRHYQSPEALSLIALTVSRADVEALHSPSLRVGATQAPTAALNDGLLAGVKLKPVLSEGTDGKPGITVQGGLLLDREGWYRFALDPPCAAATFTIDEQPVASEMKPMLVGDHTFEIALPGPTACRMPLRILKQADNERDMSAIPAGQIVGPAVAALRHGKARPVVPYAGYPEPKLFAKVSGAPVDFGMDGTGHASVLLRDHNTIRVQRFDPQGHEEAIWQPEVPAGRDLVSIAVDPAGTVFLMGDVTVLVYDRDGKPLGAWKDPTVWVNEMSFWRDGRILKALRDRNAIALLSREGQLGKEFSQFEGGPGRFSQPIAATAGPDGYIVVTQEDGQALLFRNTGDEFNPTFIRSFPVDFSALPPQPRRVLFDGSDKMLFLNVSGTWGLVYNLNGERMMAANPARDLSAAVFGDALRAEAAGGRLYVLDHGPRLWTIAR
jgi:hypothetical protein